MALPAVRSLCMRMCWACCTLLCREVAKCCPLCCCVGLARCCSVDSTCPAGWLTLLALWQHPGQHPSGAMLAVLHDLLAGPFVLLQSSSTVWCCACLGHACLSACMLEVRMLGACTKLHAVAPCCDGDWQGASDVQAGGRPHGLAWPCIICTEQQSCPAALQAVALGA